MQKPSPSTRKASGKWAGQASRHERGYGAAWDKLRKIIITRDMALCQPCLAKGRPTPFTQVDHITPKAKGGADDIDNLQCICTPCHNDKTQLEAAEAQGRRGKTRPTYGPDGWPVWDSHGAKRWGYSIPSGVKPSGIPVVLVAGPPAAGKSTYIEANAKPGDTIIDFDIYRKQLGGAKWDIRPHIIRGAFNLRDAAINSLHTKTSGTCYLIVTAPTQAERLEWVKALGNVTVHLLRTPKRVCIERIKADPDRADAAPRQIKAVIDWWAAN